MKYPNIMLWCASSVVNGGLAGDAPCTLLKNSLTGLVGDDARLARRQLNAVATACACEVVGGHHQCEAVHIGIVDDNEGAMHTVGRGEGK